MKQKQWKKVCLMVVIAVFLATFVVGCGGNGTTETTNTPSDAATQAESQQAEETSAEAVQPSEAASTESEAAVDGAETEVVATGEAVQFDDYARPKIKSDGKLKVAHLHNTLSYENQKRYYTQSQIEAYNRGWELVMIEYSGAESIRNAFLNAINQDVDAIFFMSISNFNSLEDLVIEARNKGIGVYTAEATTCEGNITNCSMPMGEIAMDLLYRVGEDTNWTGGLTVTTAYSFATVYERTIPVRAMIENGTIFPQLKFLDEQSVDFGSSISLQEQVYNFVKTWLQKYGDEMTHIFVAADMDAVLAAQAAKGAGKTADDIIMFTIDGTVGGVAEMRDPESPLAYNYTQPLENYCHNLYELVDQLQVKGMNPGDPGCLIQKAGETWNFEGVIITKENVPAAGESIHVMYDYYDPDNADGWYNWTAPDYEPYTF